MLERATGLILRVYPLTETSLIVHWLTAEHGRLATVAKGARRPKSPLRGKLDLFYLADFSFQRHPRSELHALREAVLRETHPALRREWRYLQQAAYAAALIEKTTETDTPLPGAFELLRQFLDHLPLTAPHPAPVLAFEARWLSECGLAPNPADCALTPGARQILRHLLEPEWSVLLRLKPSREQIAELDGFLRRLLEAHFDSLPRGRAAALETANT